MMIACRKQIPIAGLRLLLRSLSVVRKDSAEPVIAAERVLIKALEEYPAIATPIVLSQGAQSKGVRIVLTTPKDVDAVSVLKAALIESLHWKVESRSANSWKGLQYMAMIHSPIEGANIELRLPHTLEYHSSAEMPMSARPRLQEGILMFESQRLSIRMARALANAAHLAASMRDQPNQRTRGGPLLALDRLLDRLQLGQTDAPTVSSDPPPFFNEAALRASAANAATFPEPRITPTRSTESAGSSGGGSSRAASQALDKTIVPADAREAADLIALLGAKVVQPAGGPIREDGWAALAGGEAVRRAVDEALLMPLARPHAFAAVLQATRASAVPPTPRPTALLFHGPPGTGKTHAARIAAEMAGLPLVVAPLESLISKWYGEGEQKLAMLFARCDQLGACVLFLDELDALAGSRDREMHEASRRMLSVLLRHLDGFDSVDHVALIGATNRPTDLDAALISRFDCRVAFPPPNLEARVQVFARYAKHLSPEELKSLADYATGLSGRDILDVCKQAERRWVYRQLFDEVEAAGGLRLAAPEERGSRTEAQTRVIPPPPLHVYEKSLAERCTPLSDGTAANK